jgi:bifunctional non-homologous end joining protein LigD
MAKRATTAAADPLKTYRTKRDFERTPEPAGGEASADERWVYVVQKHAATRLHYDFRLELDGVMRSWAVPKGPSFDPEDKRIAVQTEDHPISYNTFEGTIPKGQYGAGTVIVWDRGRWQPVGDPHQGLKDGKLVFRLHGQKLAGLWELVRIQKPDEKQIPWILFKKRDAHARPRAEYDVVSALPDSVVAKPLAPAQAAAVAETRPVTRPQDVARARKAELPDRLDPQLATLASEPPSGSDWSFEIKFDGYRILTRIEGGQPKLITRGRHDWSARMTPLVQSLQRLQLNSAWLDGEVVVLGDDGLPNFNLLQNAFDSGRAERIVYFLFDLPYLEGWDLRASPLAERRALLEHLLAERAADERLRFSAAFVADARSMLQSARRLKLEGLIAKRTDAPYVSRRSETWLKIKGRQRQEFVVGGFTDRNGEPGAAEIGSLILGVYGAGRELYSVGSVGAGWNGKQAAELKQTLLPLEVSVAPFAGGPVTGGGRWSRRHAGAERWVKPELVVEVSFNDWTPDGQIRHALYEGVRLDKPARQVQREEAIDVPQPKSAPARRVQTKVSNPGRVIDATTGLTKLDLVRFYESIGEWMAPHLKGRPCSLVRGPDGIGGELFFQKHLEKVRVEDVKELDPALWPGHASLLEVPTPTAIAACAQMNVIEFHTWNARVSAIDRPDRIVFDLDPGSGVAWPRVQEAATLTRAFLQELGLEAWLKTSGGKGLHVVVPLAPRHDWDTVKGFSQAVVQHLARVIPDRFVAKSGAANRVGRIFVDYLRNSHGATTAAAFSARARPGLGVSMPVPWEMLGELKSGAQWSITTAREHLSFQAGDPWAGYWKSRQSITKAMKLLRYTPG